MYSSSAVVTASFLVLCSPRRRASSMSLSSIARFVSMCRLLHIKVCRTRLSQRSQNKNRERFPVPGLRTVPTASVKNLLNRTHFDAVASMHIFQTEDAHARRRGVGDADDYDLAHSSPRQITHVNHGTVAFGEHRRIDRRRLFLRVLGDGRFERQ